MKILLSLAALFHTVSLDGFSRHAAAALISSIWEGVLLTAAVGLCLHLLPRITARLRFAIWSATFVVLVALPLVEALPIGHDVATGLPATTPHFQLDPRWSYALAAFWLAAILIRLIHLALQALQLRSLWNSAVPVSQRDQGAPHLDFEMWDVNRLRSGRVRFASKTKLRRVELCTSTVIDRPSVIGFFSPRILIPAWLFEELTPGELDQIVLHEMEHLHRRDDWLNLLQKVGLVLFPLNPALFWIDRRLASERELACDDGVLSRTHAPRAYATCLTTLAERRLEHRRPNRLTVLALGAVGAIRRSDFSRRIESILESGLSGRAGFNPALAQASAALLISVVLGSAVILARAPQLVSFNKAPETRATFTQVVPATRESFSTRFENVVFHPAQPAVSRPVKRIKAKPRKVSPSTQIDAADSGVAPKSDRRWMVRTSWQQSAPQPVLLTLPDGRTFLATYATGPNQAGWLLIQL